MAISYARSIVETLEATKKEVVRWESSGILPASWAYYKCKIKPINNEREFDAWILIDESLRFRSFSCIFKIGRKWVLERGGKAERNLLKKHKLIEYRVHFNQPCPVEIEGLKLY